MPNFIGIDLAWQSDSNNSGAVCLHGDSQCLEIKEISKPLYTLKDIQKFILDNSYTDTIIAIDAPLVIANQTGQRPCETLIGRRYGYADACAHSSNLNKFPEPRSVELARILEELGYSHCPHPHDPTHAGKWFFEVYPHPAHVVLFGRTKIIKYKKGKVFDRRAGLLEFRASIAQYLSIQSPCLTISPALSEFFSIELAELAGKHLKHYEDSLDAVICAYLAAYFWKWGYDRCEMIGDLQTGYIINPRPQLALSSAQMDAASALRSHLLSY